MKRLAIAFVIAFAAVAVGGAGTATAGKHIKTTKVTINFTDGSPPTTQDTFFGKVKSKKAKCVKNRKVVVKRKTPSKLKIGTDLTDNEGNWEVETPNAPSGEYFAKAKKKTLSNGKICDAKKSNLITVP